MVETKHLRVSEGDIKYQQTSFRNHDLVFIHGGFGDTGIITLLEKVFGDKYRITAPFLPGHGSFDLDQKFKYTDLVSAMSQFLTQLNLTDYLLMGHSFGGRIALDISSTEESKAKREVLLAPMLAPIATSLARVTINLTRDYLKDLGLSRNGPFRSETLPVRLLNIWEIWNLIASVGKIDDKHLQTPATIIWGNRDSVLPLKKINR